MMQYNFEVPSNWTAQTIGKIEKATQGVDSRWVSPGDKQILVQVLTLAGYSQLNNDREQIIDNLAVADYELQVGSLRLCGHSESRH